MDESRFSNLLPYHVEFINSFLDPGAQPFWHLVAPPGSGKTAAAVALIGEMFRSHDAQRVLILVNAALTLQYAYMLRDESQSVPIIRVDRQFFRELEASATPGTNPWPRPIIAVVSLDLAKRPEIAQSLVGTRWDLVLVDQSHSLAGQRAALLDQMLSADAIGRLLLLGVADEGTLKVPISGLESWNWYQQAGDLFSANFPPLEVRVQVVEYRRSTTEVSFLRSLRQFAGQLSGGPTKSLQTSLMLRVASSSLYAAEQTIHRLRNQLAHEEFLSAVDADEADETVSIESDLLDEPSDAEPKLGFKHSEPEVDLKIVTNILNALDEVTDDSKFQALATLLKGITAAGATRVGVFVAYAATASYLKASLEEILGERVYELMGSMPYEERRASLSQFKQQGSVLVCSTQLVFGTDLNLDAGIVYDLPRSPTAMKQLLARFFRPGGKGPATVYLLRDLSGAIHGEEQLFRLLGSGLENEWPDIRGQRQQRSGE